ncbi:uncharacterized protein L203_106124 [Cryptococcus depauperatus CBS 7841]|uniref:U3 small nucleolar RNA-associated protein 10 n=1 Tax=Cryptococcus depauperatus CBS 7841 TaxID=1295531 RepID=A0A1E3IVA2_9TREE|nr:U3 small nucleolar RNA-associated protein 10 [Cryptococcus depauperatus CBS 7841]
MSSLAEQLQNIASLDADRLSSAYGAPSGKSYLFPPDVALGHDLDSIFDLAQSGFDELFSLDPGLEEFQEDLFSEAAKRTDRMIMSKEENDILDTILEKCLRRLGRYVSFMAGGKCIEWLVRRFRVHEMNAEAILKVFLPYHGASNFPRLLAILNIPKSSPYYAPFSPLTKNAQTVPRSYIVTAISPTKDKSLTLLNDIIAMVQMSINDGSAHRAVLAFWSSTIVDLLEGARHGSGLDDKIVKVLVEAFVTMLETPNGGEDVNAAVYPPLVLLTRTVTLADEPFAAIVSSLLTPETGANPSQRLLTLLVVLNDRPDWISNLDESASVNLAKVKQSGEILVAAMEKYGFESALKAIIDVMMKRPDLHARSLASILEHKTVPDCLVEFASTRLLQSSSKTIDDDIKLICRSLLANIRERHPVIVDSAFLQVSSSLKIDKALFSHALVQKSSNEVAFLDVYSADVSSRINGIRAVLEMAKNNKEVESAITALETRLGDTEESIIQVLYADPTSLLSVLPDQNYVAGVKPAFWAHKPSPKIIGLHLDFISQHLAFLSNIKKQLYESLLFPIFLSTERRQPLTKHEALKLLHGGLRDLDKLSKIGPEIGKARGEGVKGAQKSNLVIAKALAEATSQSTTLEDDVSFLVSQLESSLSSSRLLAYMILHYLIYILRGPLQLFTAVVVLNHLSPRLSGHSLRDIRHASDQIGSEYLDAVYRKPDEAQTTLRAVVSIVAVMNKIVKPEESFVWLADDMQVSDALYKQYTRHVYLWANSVVLPPSISQDLLQSIFTQLDKDVLLFLASIWSSTSHAVPLSVRISALKHALVFINSSSPMKDAKLVDFQVILPQILIVVQDSESDVRKAAIDVLRSIDRGDSMGEVYALDKVYGDRSETVQLLKPVDRNKYIQAILEVGNEFVLDPARIQFFHEEILGMQATKNRKDSAHRRAVIGSLMSHIVSYRAIRPRLALFSLLSNVHDTSILRSTINLLSSLLDNSSEEYVWLSQVPEVLQTQYLEALISSLKPQSVNVLSEAGGHGWIVLLSLLDVSNSSQFIKQLRQFSLRAMVSGVFSALTTHQQIEYTIALIRCIHVLPAEDAHYTLKFLKQLDLGVDSLLRLIDNLSDPLEMNASRKKQKRDDADDDRPTQAVLELSTFIDSRSWATMPANGMIVASLMTLLSSLVAKRLSIREGVDYLEQEVLSAILALVEKVNDSQEIKRANVGIEVVIKAIRASNNPRTSERALLVAAELARLIPDAVLHNVMPIFTFMGASDFQRDDAYTFSVVEKTVSIIVPVMTAALKGQAQTSIELYTKSLTFLRIFTDMAGRLPRHRTLPFFIHLVKCLGASDYLAPVCMLLVDRASTKAGRNKESVSSVLELPSSLVEGFGIPIKTQVLSEVVEELGRLVGDLSRSEKYAFLSQTIIENDASDRSIKQILHLLIFFTSLINQLKGKSCTRSLVQASVRRLISLTVATSQPVMASTEIPSRMHSALASIMLLLSADNFLSVTVELLCDGTEQDIIMCLDVFTERLPLIRLDIRSRNTKIVSEILKKISLLLLNPGASTGAVLSAVDCVTRTAVPQEDRALSVVVPAVVSCISKLKEASLMVNALLLLERLIRHLGSRSIPYVQTILDITLDLIKSTKSGKSTVKQAFTTLTSVIETIPGFISSKQLNAVLSSTLGYYSTDEIAALSFFAQLATKISTKSLFPCLMNSWKTIQDYEDDDVIRGFFEVLRLTLKHAVKEELSGMLKPVFAFFLDIFDLRHQLQLKSVNANVVNTIEESAIKSFLELVTKLSEATFKPLFIRLYDWAVVDLSESKDINNERLIARKTVFLHVTIGLLNKFRSLLSPYMAILLPHVHELLSAFSFGSLNSLPLWTLLLNTLGKSFEVDEGAFWTDTAILELLPQLVSQIPLYLSFNTHNRPISSCLASLASSTTSETVLRRLNASVCLATRVDDSKSRIAALDALKAIWSVQAEEMVTFVPETVSEFLAELLEDESKDVEILARGVLAKIEEVTGSLKEYLD